MLKKALHFIIFLFGCSAFLFSFCSDLDLEKVENDLRNSSMSQRSYLNSLVSTGNWLKGTVQSSPIKSDAEKGALFSLATHIRSQVSVITNRELDELISSDEESLEDRRHISYSFITDETIINPQIITTKHHGFWWAIALKCKEEYSKEKKEYNEKLYLESKSYYKKFINQNIYQSSDISFYFENLIKSYIFIKNLISFDQEKWDLYELLDKELDIFLYSIEINVPKQKIEVYPYSFSNKDFDLRCDFQPDINRVIPIDGIDFIAKYITGSVENFNGWGNNRKSLSVTNGHFTFDTGYITTQSVDLEVILYPDINYIVSSLEEKYLLWDISYRINPETISKLKKLITEHSSTKIFHLHNGGKIPTFVDMDPKVGISRDKILDMIGRNILFKVSNNRDNARVICSIQKDEDEINISVSLRNQTGQLEKISEKVIRRSLDLLYIEQSIRKLFESIFETNLEYEIGRYDDCDENVSIVIENAKYDTPKEIKNIPGKIRSGSIPVMKGKVNYKIYYNKENSIAFYDTTFYITTVKDLNDFRNICFEKKEITYLLTFSTTMLPEKKSKLIWDGKNKTKHVKSGNTPTHLRGLRHEEHNIVYKKNGFKPFKSTISPTNEIEYPILIAPDKVRLNAKKNMKHIILPGTSQIELYQASRPKQIQGYIYEVSYLSLLGKTIYHYINYNNHLDQYNSAADQYSSSIDKSQAYYETLNNEVNLQRDLIDQELNDLKTFGLYFGILFVTNIIEVTINNILF